MTHSNNLNEHKSVLTSFGFVLVFTLSLLLCFSSVQLLKASGLFFLIFSLWELITLKYEMQKETMIASVKVS